VIAGHDDHLALGAQPLAERLQDRLGDLHRLLGTALEQLDDVAEQDQSIDFVERAEQGLERLGAAKHVAPQAGAEMEIGDDQGARDRVKIAQRPARTV
jgi:hypothetical protein